MTEWVTQRLQKQPCGRQAGEQRWIDGASPLERTVGEGGISHQKLGAAQRLRALPFRNELVEQAVLFAHDFLLPAGTAPKPNITGLRI